MVAGTDQGVGGDVRKEQDAADSRDPLCPAQAPRTGTR